ncbi:MAG: hypothetical protein NDF57_05395 [archaeon GBS-70-058]|nr:hypothetical protein [Candidatus Culexarchaeum nevadense]
MDIDKLKKELGIYDLEDENVKIFVEDYVPIRLQEIFSELNDKFGLNVVEVIVFNGKLIIVCKSGSLGKTILGLTAKQENHTSQ